MEIEYYFIRCENKYKQRKKYLENIAYKVYVLEEKNDTKIIRYKGKFKYNDTLFLAWKAMTGQDNQPNTLKIYTEFPYEIDMFDIDDIELRITDTYIKNDIRYIECPFTSYSLQFIENFLYEQDDLLALIRRRTYMTEYSKLNTYAAQRFITVGKLFKMLFIFNGYSDGYIRSAPADNILYDEEPHLYNSVKYYTVWSNHPEERYVYTYIEDLDKNLDNWGLAKYRYRICKHK